MKYFKLICFIVIVSALIISSISYAAVGHSNTPVSIDVTTRINYVLPTCNVNVAPAYALGELTKGPAKTHADLLVDIDCENTTDVITSLTVSSSANTVTSNLQKLQLMNGNDHAWLSLTDSNTGADLDVSFDDTTTFCSSIQNVNNRTCELKVRTQIESGNTVVGEFSIPVIFSLVYF